MTIFFFLLTFDLLRAVMVFVPAMSGLV
jgi:hypothetical protein